MSSVRKTTPRHRRLRRGAAIGVAGGMLLASVATATTAAQAAPPPDSCDQYPWMDTSLSTDERVQAVLDASTLQQKYRWLSASASQNPTETSFLNGDVVFAEALPCLPEVLFSDGPQGKHRTEGVTSFPVPIAAASSWNLDLASQKGEVQAVETFDKGSNVIFAPGLSGSRTPLAGRTSEYLGEDTLLGGLLAGANVNGMQNADETRPIVATIKHYTGNEQETDRAKTNSIMSERTFYQVYGLSYDIALEDSDPLGAMCSFNQINGVYACENPLVNTHLRDTAGFKGWVVSDLNAIHSVAPAIKAGIDMELGDSQYIPEKLDAAIAAGELIEADIDTAAGNTLYAFIEAGLFDHYVPTDTSADVSTPANKEVALAMAEQGSVLLKNESALPISPEAGQTIALIGQTVSNTPTGSVSAKTVCSAWLRFVSGPILTCEDNIDPLTAFTERATTAGQTVVYNNGADPAAAAAAAAAADIAVVFGHYTSGEFADIPDLRLDGNGDELIAAVAAANERTVVVSETGSAVEMPWIDDVAGVVQAWYPGEQGGPALANLFWGDTNFSGKLPMTFPKSLADTPTNTPEQFPGVLNNSTGTRDVSFSEELEVGYKWYDEQGIEPLFEFGHGLSYSSFEYSNLAVDSNVDSDSGRITTNVAFTVKNTSDTAGTEIPQAYLTLPAEAEEPGKRLAAFDRIELAAGEERRIEATIDSDSAARPFAIWDESTGSWENVLGDYQVSVGASSRELPLTQTVAIKAETGGENPGGENPGGENPGGENPGGENPGGENPGGENPGGENPDVAPSVSLSAKTVEAGGTLKLTAADFEADSALAIELHSTPVALASATTDGAGAYSGSVTIPVSTDPGAHKIVVTAANGDRVEADITVTAQVSSVDLASTGSDLAIPGIIGAALLLLTGVALVIARRARANSTSN